MKKHRFRTIDGALRALKESRATIGKLENRIGHYDRSISDLLKRLDDRAMLMESGEKCANCGCRRTGNYCAHCGTKIEKSGLLRRLIGV